MLYLADQQRCTHQYTCTSNCQSRQAIYCEFRSDLGLTFTFQELVKLICTIEALKGHKVGKKAISVIIFRLPALRSLAIQRSSHGTNETCRSLGKNQDCCRQMIPFPEKMASFVIKNPHQIKPCIRCSRPNCVFVEFL